MVTVPDKVYRDFEVIGNPDTDPHKPLKKEIRDLLNWMSIGTVALLTAMAGPSESFYSYVKETNSYYQFVPADTSTANGWTVLTPTGGGTAGRWLHVGDVLTVPPLSFTGAGGSDSARLTAAGAACALSGKKLQLEAGVYILTTKWTWPIEALRCDMTALTELRSGLSSTGSPANAAIYCTPGLEAASTTISAPNVVGAYTVAVTSAASIAVGNMIRIRDVGTSTGFHGSTYEVLGIVGTTITVDRPVLTQFGATDDVDIFLAIPTGHKINGNGAIVTGGGDRLFEFIAVRDCNVDDLHFRPDTVTDIVASFDLFGYNNHFGAAVPCSAVQGASSGTSGFTLESQESSTVRVLATGFSGPGVIFFDCEHCFDYSECYGNGFGVAAGGDGNVTGCNACGLYGVYDGNTSQGIAVINGSRKTDIRATARFNPTNVSIGDGAGGNVSGTRVTGSFSSATVAGIQIFSQALNNKLSDVDVSNCPIGINNSGAIVGAQNVSCHGTASTNAVLNAAGILTIRGIDIDITTAANTILTTGAGRTVIIGGRIEAGAAANLTYLQNTSTMYLEGIEFVSTGASNAAVVDSGTTVQFGYGNLYSVGVVALVAGTVKRVPNTLSKQTGSVGTTAVTTEETLFTYTIPASTLKPGQKIVMTAWGTTANNSNTKTVRTRFGGNSIQATPLAVSNNASWKIVADIHCTAANAQEYITVMVSDGISTDPLTATLTVTDTSTIVILVSGQNGTANANDIVGQGMEVVHVT